MINKNNMINKKNINGNNFCFRFQGFLLLPLFHTQLFFFLLESMGGNAFVLCLGWVLVPSVTTRYLPLREGFSVAE